MEPLLTLLWIFCKYHSSFDILKESCDSPLQSLPMVNIKNKELPTCSFPPALSPLSDGVCIDDLFETSFKCAIFIFFWYPA